MEDTYQKIKVYGERNSGTNYLTQLLLSNFRVELINYIPTSPFRFLLNFESYVGLLYELNKKKYLGWKHGIPPLHPIQQISQDILIFTITKNPYAFLLSLYKRPYHYRRKNEQSFSQFIRSRWQTIQRDGLQWKSLKNPIALWNIKNKTFFALAQKNANTTLVRYEDLLVNPEEWISRVHNKYAFKLDRIGSFKNIENSTKEDPIRFEEYKNFYVRELWRDQLRKEDILFINEHLDMELMNQLGYNSLYPKK